MGVGLIAAAVLVAVLFLLMLRTKPVVVNYSVESKVSAPIRLVHLSDLHGWSFGEENRDLIALVKAQNPELIMLTGDMVHRSAKDPDDVVALIKELSRICPVYFGYGNHDRDWEKTHPVNLAELFTEAGATVLDRSYTEITLNGTDLRIGGYHSYYARSHMSQDDVEIQAEDEAFFQDFENTERMKILLNHVPTSWLDWGLIDEIPVDLVLSGHYHGGQARLPLIGGVIAPYIGLFPRYTMGMFTGEKAVCILSAGLGSAPGIPRLNNPPQVVVVDLLPRKGA